jgi:hypothetical protein
VRPSSGSLAALDAAMSHHGPTGVWSFQPATERRLLAEICQGHRVLIFFAVTGSQAVQGAAIFTGQTMREGTRVGQKLEWVSSMFRCRVSFVKGFIQLISPENQFFKANFDENF